MNGGPSLTLFPRTTNECVVPCSGTDKDRYMGLAQAMGTKGHFSGQLTNRTEREGMKLNKS